MRYRKSRGHPAAPLRGEARVPPPFRVAPKGLPVADFRAVEGEQDCATVLQQATASRGALDGSIAEVIEDHIRQNVVEADDPAAAKEAAEELIGIVHSYLT